MTTGWRMVARAFGGPEVIAREAFDPGAPAAGEILIATKAAGLNFIDVYHRSGVYPADLPLALGAESVGRVLAVGEGVTGFDEGDRVGCVSGLGAYATHRRFPAGHAVRIPDGIAAEDAAATMLKGFTAGYLAEMTATLRGGETVLVHSAAGGVGAILVPWLRDKRVTVIAHVGSAAKAREVDADHVLTMPFAELAEAVRGLTGGAGAAVAFDGVGQASWDASIASLARRGLMVSYGNASGAAAPVAPLALMRAGSIYLTRPTLGDYIATPDDLATIAEALFDRMRRGVVKPRIGARYPLAQAAEAQRALEARETTGSTVLLV